MSYYTRLCRTTKDRGILIPTTENLEDHIEDYNIDTYTSIYEYSEAQFQEFKENKTVAGILDVKTTKLVFDLDSATDLEKAKKETIELTQRLKKFQIPSEAIQIYFSGKKGFTVVIETDQRLSPSQVRALCLDQLGKGLSTIDPAIYNASRILRVPYTKHQETGLYKIPLGENDLKRSVADIKRLASDLKTAPEFNYEVFHLNTELLPKEEVKHPKSLMSETTKFLDFTLKPTYLSNCKYAILHGHFSDGHRNNLLYYLAATYRNQGFPSEVTYRLLKGSAELQAQKHDNDRLPDEEIYQMIAQVYGPHWKGGQGSCRPGTKTSDLRDFCQSLGEYACQHESNQELTVNINNVYSLFTDYATHFHENILYTGIPDLDENCKFMVGTTNAIVGPPGVGKTSLMLQILKHNSDNNIPCIFFSYDMFHAAVYMRMLQGETGCNQDEIYEIFKNNKTKAQELHNKVQERYKNVEFCFKSMQTPDEMIETIRETEARLGKKVKLIVIDYNELVQASASDPTSASAEVAQKVRQIANEEKLCAILLLQPSKLYSRPNDDVTTYNSAKGSGSIAQAQTLMLGLSRPGYSSRHPETDKYFTISCVKNRNGGLFAVDLGWDGLRGQLYELTDEQLVELQELRQRLEAEKKEGNKFPQNRT